MLKDNAFMTAFHEAEAKYGNGEWPETDPLVLKVRKLSGVRVRGRVSKRKSKTRNYAGTIYNSKKLMLIDCAHPTKVLGTFHKTIEVANFTGNTRITINRWRSKMIQCSLDSNSKTAIYEGERCLLIDKPEAL